MQFMSIIIITGTNANDVVIVKDAKRRTVKNVCTALINDNTVDQEKKKRVCIKRECAIMTGRLQIVLILDV